MTSEPYILFWWFSSNCHCFRSCKCMCFAGWNKQQALLMGEGLQYVCWIDSESTQNYGHRSLKGKVANGFLDLFGHLGICIIAIIFFLCLSTWFDHLFHQFFFLVSVSLFLLKFSITLYISIKCNWLCDTNR